MWPAPQASPPTWPGPETGDPCGSAATVIRPSRPPPEPIGSLPSSRRPSSAASPSATARLPTGRHLGTGRLDVPGVRSDRGPADHERTRPAAPGLCRPRPPRLPGRRGRGPDPPGQEGQRALGGRDPLQPVMGRYERQGIFVRRPGAGAGRAGWLADEDARQRRLLREEERRAEEHVEFRATFAQAITELLSGCPPERAQGIARHAGARRSGRVGRSAAGRAFDPDAITLAVVVRPPRRHGLGPAAHVRRLPGRGPPTGQLQGQSRRRFLEVGNGA